MGTCDVLAGRRPTGAELLRLVKGYQQRSGVYDDHTRAIVTTGPTAGNDDHGDETPKPTGGS